MAGSVMAWSNDSAPQSPHPVLPTRLRRFSFNLAKGSAVIVRASSIPLSVSVTSQSSSCLALSKMPSLKLKPKAKSSRFAGVAIITTWEIPL